MRRIQLLDYARLFAAACVMCFHYLFNGIHNGKVGTMGSIPVLSDIASFGYLGVDFFFIISGFVIAYSYHGKTPGAFAASRLVRMFPAFWAGVIFTSCLASALGSGETAVTLPQVVANFTMIPQPFGYRFVDGVYWTLQYELAFYGLVFTMLLLGLGERIDRFFMLWPWLMLAAYVLGYNKLPFLGGYFTYFAAGAALARSGGWPRKLAIPTLGLAIGLSMIYGAEKAQELAALRHVLYHPLLIAAIIAAMFAFFFLLRNERVARWSLPGSALAGGLTYPLYLIHAHFGYMALTAIGTEANKAFAIPLMMMSAIAVALLIHLVIEKRMRPVWTWLFKRAARDPIDRVWIAILTIGSGAKPASKPEA